MAKQVGLRLPPDAIRRVDALMTKLAKDRTVSALGQVSRSTVVRLAVMRGLDVLEKEYEQIDS